MKVIANTNHGYLLETTKDEIANLIGFSSNWHSEREGKILKIGEGINISGMYNYLYELGDARKKLKEAAKQMRDLAEKTELISPLIPEKKEA